jgi:hypothetical protein
MAPIPISKLLKLYAFTTQQRQQLKRALQKRKNELDAAIRALGAPTRAKKKKRKKR